METLAVYRKMADYDTVLLHGSAIAVDDEGYFFTAKSGTGKSTHARLWREMLGDRAVMINDDNRLGGGRKAILKYCLNRIFPPMVYIKLYYPFVYKHKIWMPFLPIYRFGKGLAFYRIQLKEEIVKLIKTKT